MWICRGIVREPKFVFSSKTVDHFSVRFCILSTAKCRKLISSAYSTPTGSSELSLGLALDKTWRSHLTLFPLFHRFIRSDSSGVQRQLRRHLSDNPSLSPSFIRETQSPLQLCGWDSSAGETALWLDSTTTVASGRPARGSRPQSTACAHR